MDEQGSLKSGWRVPDFFHVHERRLAHGELIHSGRWGQTVQSWGGKHPFFFREHLLEVWRIHHTKVGVSRLTCAFAFEELEHARKFATAQEYVHQVSPVDPSAPCVRLDMLWLTWMGEPGGTTDQMIYWCSSYWAGRATSDISPAAHPTWEWLFTCPLRVEAAL